MVPFFVANHRFPLCPNHGGWYASSTMMTFALTLALAAAAAPLSPRTLKHRDHFLRHETRYDVEPGHESTVRIREDENGVPQKTPYAALIISGLFNSPRSMRPIEDYFAARGLNVVNLRLAGHYEADPRALTSRVTWPIWRAQSQRGFALARELGERVILIGHSTGGLLVTWLAVDEPEPVAGLGLFAPAFGLAKPTGALVRVAKAVGFHSTIPDGRLKTGHAAVEVRELGNAYRAAMLAADPRPHAHEAARLAEVHVWMANLTVDGIIDLAATKTFYRAVKRAGRAPRAHDRESWCSGLLHDHLASEKNPRLPKLLRVFDTFLKLNP